MQLAPYTVHTYRMCDTERMMCVCQPEWLACDSLVFLWFQHPHPILPVLCGPLYAGQSVQGAAVPYTRRVVS